MTESEVDTSGWKKTPDGIPIPPPSPDDVLYEVRDGVAWITLNRPVVLNALNKNVQRLLLAAVERAEADAEVRVLLLIGSGRAFSAGGDMWAGLYPDDDPAPGGPEVQRRIWGLSKPVVAAVRGHPGGPGGERAGSCDLTIASETARFGEIQIRHGFPPPMLISPYQVGMKQAKELMLLGEVYDAHDAVRLGLANRVVPDEELEAEAEGVAKKLSALPQNVVRLNKALVNRVYALAGIEAGLDWREDEGLRELASSRDATAAGRHRLRQEKGWAAFKAERDQGYRAE